MPKTISVIEYERVGKEKFDEKDYKLLKELCHQEEFKEIMSCYNSKICFDKFAGVIQLKSGTFIEVLPKTCFAKEKDDIGKSKEIFVKMIKTLKSSYYKSFDNTRINNEKFPLLEVFITIFLNELDILLKHGLRKNYVRVCENSNFVKGKIKIIENIRYNIAHHEKNYVEYSEFTQNIAKNKILKKCIVFLKSKSTSNENIKRLTQALFVFDDIDDVYDIKAEFQKIHISRLNSHYSVPLELAKVFLCGNSFLPQSGSNNLISLMFPLNKLFEDYVFNYLNKTLDKTKYIVKAQSNPYCLLDDPQKFRLKPDIVIEYKNENKIAILDTKWKLLDCDKIDGKNGVSQNDLYQLYAYGKKYKEKTSKTIELFLVYPMTEKFTKPETWEYEQDSLIINLIPFDIKNDDNFLQNLI